MHPRQKASCSVIQTVSYSHAQQFRPASSLWSSCSACPQTFASDLQCPRLKSLIGCFAIRKDLGGSGSLSQSTDSVRARSKGEEASGECPIKNKQIALHEKSYQSASQFPDSEDWRVMITTLLLCPLSEGIGLLLSPAPRRVCHKDLVTPSVVRVKGHENVLIPKPAAGGRWSQSSRLAANSCRSLLK